MFHVLINILLNGLFPASFNLYYGLFNTVNECSIKFGFEPGLSRVGSDHSANCATFSAPFFNIRYLFQPMMYGAAGASGGSLPFNNGQCSSNGFQPPYNAAAPPSMQQFAAPQQQQGMWPQQQQQQPGYDRFYNNYNNGATSNSFAANTQYPQNSSSVNSSMPQWNSQVWNSWQQQQTQPQQQQQQQQPAIPQQQQQLGTMPQQQQQPQGTAINGVANGAANGAALTGVKRCDAYQRTFDYVQQCQTWTSQQ